MHHTQLQNETEQLFGVLKCRFRILLLALEYSHDIQNCIPVALAAVHNFILHHEPLDFPEGAEDIVAECQCDPNNLNHCASSEQASEQEQINPTAWIGNERHDRVARTMWVDYAHRMNANGKDCIRESTCAMYVDRGWMDGCGTSNHTL